MNVSWVLGRRFDRFPKPVGPPNRSLGGFRGRAFRIRDPFFAISRIWHTIFFEIQDFWKKILRPLSTKSTQKMRKLIFFVSIHLSRLSRNRQSLRSDNSIVTKFAGGLFSTLRSPNLWISNPTSIRKTQIRSSEGHNSFPGSIPYRIWNRIAFINESPRWLFRYLGWRSFALLNIQG